MFSNPLYVALFKVLLISHAPHPPSFILVPFTFAVVKRLTYSKLIPAYVFVSPYIVWSTNSSWLKPSILTCLPFTVVQSPIPNVPLFPFILTLTSAVLLFTCPSPVP